MLLQRCQVLLDLGYAVVVYMVLTIGNYQSGSALDTVLDAQVLVIISNQLFVSYACLAQQLLSNTAVGTGNAGEQNSLAFCCYGSRYSNLFLHSLDLLDHGNRLLQNGSANIVNQTILELLALAVVPVLNRTVITGNTAVDLGLLAALRTGVCLTTKDLPYL